MFQPGFWRGLSRETTLNSPVHEWPKVLNERGQIDLVFLDFAKACDSVPHKRLISKVDSCGIRGNSKLWIKNFLIDRR